MASQTFDSVSLSDWQPVDWAGNGYTAYDLSCFLVNPADYSSELDPLSGDGNGGLDLSVFSAPAGTDLSTIGGQPNVGALVDTRNSFKQEYGYFEMTAKLSDTPGTISAFWLLPADGQVPPELDVAEVIGNSPTTLVNTTHSAVSGTNTSWVDTSDTSQGFHTYAADWEPNTITWYFDGQQVAQQTTPSDMNTPMYMVLSEESGSGSSWEGAPPSSFRATMDVQSVRAWTSNPYTSSTANQTYNSTSGAASSASSSSTSATSSASSDTAASVGASAIVGSASGGVEFVYDTTGGGSTGSAPNYSFIPDFNPQVDALDFRNTAQSFGSISIDTASDGHAIIESDHNVVSLLGVTPSQLNDRNILFNETTS